MADRSFFLYNKTLSQGEGLLRALPLEFGATGSHQKRRAQSRARLHVTVILICNVNARCSRRSRIKQAEEASSKCMYVCNSLSSLYKVRTQAT